MRLNAQYPLLVPDFQVIVHNPGLMYLSTLGDYGTFPAVVQHDIRETVVVSGNMSIYKYTLHEISQTLKHQIPNPPEYDCLEGSQGDHDIVTSEIGLNLNLNSYHSERLSTVSSMPSLSDLLAFTLAEQCTLDFIETEIGCHLPWHSLSKKASTLPQCESQDHFRAYMNLSDVIQSIDGVGHQVKFIKVIKYQALLDKKSLTEIDWLPSTLPLL